jgi:hypothetical protein
MSLSSYTSWLAPRELTAQRRDKGWDGEGECGASNLGDANDRLVHGVWWDADQMKDVVKMLCLRSATHMDRPR